MTIVPANYTAWSLRVPEFGNGIVTEPLYDIYFAEASLYVANDDCALIPADATTFQPRASILQMVTAHIAKLNATINGQPPSPIVGRINQASEGSVSVGAELNTPQSAAWWAQTAYGLQAWQMCAPYRMARYRPSPGRFPQNGPPGPFPTINRQPFWGFRQ